jgi:ubiquinone/menaquinone biosynthesis C-methylase UbiE
MTQDLERLEASDWYRDDRPAARGERVDPVQLVAYRLKHRTTDAEAAALLDELSAAPGMRMADLACGTGPLACQAALRGCEVLAADPSESLLESLRLRAERLGARGLTTQMAGLLSFDVHASSLDLVTTQYSLHHLNDFWKLFALQRMFTALAPGGRLLLRDIVYSRHPSELRATVDAWLAWMQQEHGECREESVSHVRDEHGTFAWVLEGLIERAGFRALQARYERGVFATYIVQRPI